MKKNIKTILIVVISSFLMQCAGPLSVTKAYQHNPQQPIKRMGLFPVMLGKPYKPVLPLIDAAIFNKKLHGIASEITALQKDKVIGLRETASTTIAKYFKAEMIISDSLISHPFHVSLGQKKDLFKGLQTEDQYFPEVITAPNDLAPFRFEKGEVLKYFKNPEKAKFVISNMCKEFDLDALAVSYSVLNFSNVLPFGISANVNLITSLYIFDKQGNLIGQAQAYSRGFQSRGKDVAEYELALDDFQAIFEPLVQKLVSGLLSQTKGT